MDSISVDRAASPVSGAVTRYSRELIEETIRVWQPYYEAPLTEADAREIIGNMTAFAAVLLNMRPPDRPRAGTYSKSDKSRP